MRGWLAALALLVMSGTAYSGFSGGKTSKATDPDLDISKGTVVGSYSVHKFGANDAVGTSAFEIVTPYEGVDPFPTTADTLIVVSSSDSDSTGNAGALAVVVQGLDENWALVADTLSLKGTGQVMGTVKFFRAFRAWVDTSGTYGTIGAGSNVGGIAFIHNGTADTMLTIPAGFGQTQYAGYSVPTGKTAYLKSGRVDVSVGTNKDAEVRLRFRPNADDVSAPYSGASRIVERTVGAQGTETYEFGVFPALPGPCDIWVEAKGSATTQVQVAFDLIVVDN